MDVVWVTSLYFYFYSCTYNAFSVPAVSTPDYSLKTTYTYFWDSRQTRCPLLSSMAPPQQRGHANPPARRRTAGTPAVQTNQAARCARDTPAAGSQTQ